MGGCDFLRASASLQISTRVALLHLRIGVVTEGPYQNLADVNMQFMPFEELSHPLVSLLTLIKGTKKCKLLRLQVRCLEKLSLLSQGSCM